MSISGLLPCVCLTSICYGICCQTATLAAASYDSNACTHAGDYDYDESDELPAGCKYADAQIADMNGVLNLISAPGQAGAPAAGTASFAGQANPEVPDNALSAASQQGARLRGTDSSLNGSRAQVQILCGPVPARRADAGQSSAASQQSSGRGGFDADPFWPLLIWLFSMVGLCLCLIACGGCTGKGNAADSATSGNCDGGGGGGGDGGGDGGGGGD